MESPAGTVVTFIPFIEWGKFLPNPSGNVSSKAQVELPDGTQANIKTFPVNHSESVIYPKTNDKTLNQESFRLWQFIRLPLELGGDKNDVSAFRMYSMICLHLWCLWKYWPDTGRKRGECPCHGSMYNPINGKAFAGPASLQSPPSNVISDVRSRYRWEWKPMDFASKLESKRKRNCGVRSIPKGVRTFG